MASTDRAVRIPSGDIEIAGTLLIPEGEGKRPAALIINGSGPLDRDGNHKQLPLAVASTLADALADIGWASLRFDKRGVGESGGDYLTTGFFEELEDARSAVRWLSDQPEFDPIIVIGHSIGATYAAELCATEPSIAGGVLLSYTAKDGRATLVWQANEIAGTIPGWTKRLMAIMRTSVQKQQEKALAKLAASTKDVERSQGQKINARWMREFMAYDPLGTLRMVKTPMLAITGSKDVQVDPSDLEIVASILGDRGQVHVVPDVDHILRHEAEPLSDVRRYKKQVSEPLDTRVVALIEDWLSAIG